MIDFFVDQDKIRDAQNRLLDFADGMDRAFNSSFEASVWENKRRSEREVRTLVSIIRSENGYIQAIPGLADRYLGREGNLKLIDSSVPLRAFKATQTPEGVVVELTRAGVAQQIFRGAFGPKIVKLGGNIYRRAGKQRFPIIKLADLKVSKIDGVESTFRESVKQYKVSMVKRLERAKQKLSQEFGKGIVNVASQT